MPLSHFLNFHFMRGDLLWRSTAAHHVRENMELVHVTIKQYYKENGILFKLLFCKEITGN